MLTRYEKLSVKIADCWSAYSRCYLNEKYDMAHVWITKVFQLQDIRNALTIQEASELSQRLARG